MRAFTAASLFDGQELVEGGAVAVDADGVVVASGPRGRVEAETGARAELVDGLLMPGLVDAFTIPLDSFLRGRAQLGAGFDAWLDSVRIARGATDDSEIDAARTAALDAALGHGVAALADVTLSESSHRALARLGIASVTLQQMFGTERYAATVALEAAVKLAPRDARWVPAAHSPTTLHSDVARVTLREARRRGGPACIQAHVSPAGAAGPPQDALDALDDLGALEPGTLLAHVGALGEAGWARLHGARVRVVVSPRAALAVEVRLPPVGAMLAAGLTPAIGTGSAGASGGNDPLAEVRAVHERFPLVPLQTLLAMVTSAGADALGLDRHGRLSPGARPGLLLLEGTPPTGVASAARAWLGRSRLPRRWLVAPRADTHGTATAHEALAPRAASEPSTTG